MKERKRVKIYMLELIQLVISIGGKNAAVFESLSDDEIAEFIHDVPEVEILF